MKQTKENGKQNKTNKKKVFSTTMGLCALCTFFSSSHCSHFFRLIDTTCHDRRQLLYTSEVSGEGEEKKNKSYGSECKTAFGRVLKPTIYIYTDMHILPSVYLIFYS